MSTPDAPVADPALADFVAKAWAREPGLRVAATFCAPAKRDAFAAWSALLDELAEAAFELSDARVTEVKCAWWAEELAGWANGRSRHPLGRVLAGASRPWAPLGQALLGLAEGDATAADTAGAMGDLRPAANAVVAIEAALFAGAASEAAVDAFAIHWLARRLPVLRGAPLIAQAREAFDRARLQGLARTGRAGQPAALATLWRAWRAARRAAQG
jgi:hypothetical protein